MRGDIYELSPRPGEGHEQQGDRLGVIVQTDAFAWSTTLVAPTSTRARPMSFRPQIQLGAERTTVLVDQTTAVDAGKRLSRMVGRVTLAEMQDIEAAFRIVLDL